MTHARPRPRRCAVGLALAFVVLDPSRALAGDDAPVVLDPHGGDPPVYGVELTKPPRTPRMDEPWFVFLNFDGAELSACGYNDPKTNCTRWYTDTIKPFAGDIAERASIVQEVREDIAPFNMVAIDQRPPDDAEYDMEMIGDFTNRTFPEGVGGIAPDGYDCMNGQGGDISYTMDTFGSLGERPIPTSIQKMAILQELAHSWGLEHVESNRDILFPVAGTGVDPEFVDECLQITTSPVETGEPQEPTRARCPNMHAVNCSEPDHQNSYQDMMMMFGPHVPDLTGPTVEIAEPADGAVVDSTFDLVVDLADNFSPQVFDVVVYLDGVEGASGAYVDTTLVFPIMNLPDGDYVIRVEATDEDGNPGMDEVAFAVGESDGDGGTDDGDDDGDGDTGDDGQGDGGGDGDGDGDADDVDGGAGDAEGCGCDAPGGTPAAASLIPLVLGLRRRRPRARSGRWSTAPWIRRSSSACSRASG